MKTLFDTAERNRLLEAIPGGAPKAIDIMGQAKSIEFTGATIGRIPNAFVVKATRPDGTSHTVAKFYFQDDKPRAKRHAWWDAKITLKSLKRTLGLEESSKDYGLTARVVRSSLPDIPEPHGRDAVIILTAVKGHARAARALVSKAIKKVLKVRKWHTEPHHVHFTSGRESGSYGGGKDGRYTLRVTDAEMRKLGQEIERMAKADGWGRAPVDIYHD